VGIAEDSVVSNPEQALDETSSKLKDRKTPDLSAVLVQQASKQVSKH